MPSFVALRGRDSALLDLSRFGTGRLITSSHIYSMVYARLPKLAASGGQGKFLQAAIKIWEQQYLPRIPFVDVSDMHPEDPSGRAREKTAGGPAAGRGGRARRPGVDDRARSRIHEPAGASASAQGGIDAGRHPACCSLRARLPRNAGSQPAAAGRSRASGRGRRRLRRLGGAASPTPRRQPVDIYRSAHQP